MRALTGFLILGVLVAFPSSARAEAAPLCPADERAAPSSLRYQERLGGLLWDAGLPAVRAALGGQFAHHWMDTPRQGWTVAYSPGTHDASTARAAIREQLAARVGSDDAAQLERTLALVPTPYSRAELDAALAEVSANLPGPGNIVSTVAIGCRLSDAVRVEVRIGPDETPEVRAQAEALVAPLGDRARVQYGFGWITLDQRPTLKVRDYVSLPRTSRCARTVRARPRVEGVKRVRLAIGKRVSAGTAPRLTLRSRRSKVTVTVTLTDGSVAIETLTYRRC